MFTITIRLDEKRSTTSQFENVHAGVQLEASNLELSSSQEILSKTAELFALAKTSVEQQLSQAVPSRGNSAPSGGGNGQPRGEAHRSYGRPSPEPTAKQRNLLRRIARDRALGPEQFGEICNRLIGKPLNAMDRRDVSRLIEALLEDEAA